MVIRSRWNRPLSYSQTAEYVSMNHELLMERFFEVLIAGDRTEARRLVRSTLQDGLTPTDLVTDVFWPTYETVEKLFRADQLTKLAHHLSSRLLRLLVDQNAARLEIPAPNGKNVLAFCGPLDAEELGAQMAVDLLEAGGFTVSFAGGGIPNDEILAQVHETRPDVLLMFASSPTDLPDMRSLIDTLTEIGACPNLQFVVGGGVFNRAEGLAEEIGADLWASTPIELVEAMTNLPEQRAAADQRTVGRKRKVGNQAAA